ncbi:MAG: aspartate aminotransferase family protein [bacterium]|nr:aspartate aminotransferase family protein [Gammaproteobacteria bacterium]HIL97019.1 aspartate aminotransferase family protein [Pseudomonadales bacterium]
MSKSTLLERRQQLIGHAALFYRSPVHIVRGDGVYLYDHSGKRYIDMYNNVPCVGHANPHVVAAMEQQMGTLNVHSRYLHEGILDFAERLLSYHHDKLEQAVFACSGTEASEIALMMARYATGGRGIICSDATYHGNSTEVSKMSARPVDDPDFRSIPFPQTYRPLVESINGDALTQAYLAKLQLAIDDFAENNIPFAGLFVCSIFANEGLPDLPDGFMSRAVDLVHKAGGVVIADEVQAGYCRSGNWWGYETSDFIPDIVTMGKPMGNGLPVSAVVSSADMVRVFRTNTHYFNTFASSPVQAATAMAVLDVIEQDDLLNRSAMLGEQLRRELTKMQDTCEAMGDVRGCGLFVGVEWVSDRAAKTADRAGAADVANRMKDKGFLLSNAGAFGNVVKIRPPLVFQQDHADTFLEAFAEMLAEIA